MMRFTGALSAALAGVLVVPAFTQQGSTADSLRTALDETIHALRVLTGLERDARAGAELQSEQVLALTEPPPSGPRELDERLVAEREAVATLRMRVESIEAGAIPAGTRPLTEAGADGSNAPVPPQAVARPTTGLDPELKAALGEIGISPAKPGSTGAGGTRFARPEPTAVRTLPVAGELPREHEPRNYSADPLGQARACYRAGRHEEGLALLASPGPDPVAWYWRGRLLEKLDRTDDAMAAYRKVLELAPVNEGNSAAGAVYERERAQANLEFLEWKLEFLKEVPQTAGAAKQGGRVR